MAFGVGGSQLSTGSPWGWHWVFETGAPLAALVPVLPLPDVHGLGHSTRPPQKNGTFESHPSQAAS